MKKIFILLGVFVFCLPWYFEDTRIPAKGKMEVEAGGGYGVSFLPDTIGGGPILPWIKFSYGIAENDAVVFTSSFGGFGVGWKKRILNKDGKRILINPEVRIGYIENDAGILFILGNEKISIGTGFRLYTSFSFYQKSFLVPLYLRQNFGSNCMGVGGGWIYPDIFYIEVLVASPFKK